MYNNKELHQREMTDKTLKPNNKFFETEILSFKDSWNRNNMINYGQNNHSPNF
jgi:hypothetical protein